MSKVSDASEIFKAWLDGRLFFDSDEGIDDDERGLIEEAIGSSEPLDRSRSEQLGLSPGTTIGRAAEILLADPGKLRRHRHLEDVTIDPSIEARTEYSSVVRRANEILAEEMGRTSVPTSVSWSLHHDSSRQPRLWLVLSDGLSRLTRPFAPEQLRNDRETRRQLSKLWGDLLQIRSHKLIDEMRASVAEAEGSRGDG